MTDTPAPRRVTVVPRAAVTRYTERQPDSAPKSQRPNDPNGRRAAIRTAIEELDLADPTHVTEDGRPDATVLSDLLGWQVPAEERDAAWAEIEAASSRSRSKKKE